MLGRIRAIQYGCGPIGCNVAKLAATRADIQLVGAVDIDPEKVGRDLGELAGLGKNIGVKISRDVQAVIADTAPHVVFLTTSSNAQKIYPQIEEIVHARVNVVTTAEELSYPSRAASRLAADLDELAIANEVTILSTGINPGFLMDAWPLFMTGVCQEVEQITATRIQDASPRRLPFQKKIGAGRTPEEFATLVKEGKLRHVGLPESAAMIAAGLGWEIDDLKEEIEPVIARQAVSSQYITVAPGQAAGVHQVARVYCRGREAITLDFQAYLGAPDPRDEVRITGVPNLEVVIKGGVHGDIGTAAMVVNAARRVVEAPSGLLTMKDIPMVVCTAGQASLVHA